MNYLQIVWSINRRLLHYYLKFSVHSHFSSHKALFTGTGTVSTPPPAQLHGACTRQHGLCVQLRRLNFNWEMAPCRGSALLIKYVVAGSRIVGFALAFYRLWQWRRLVVHSLVKPRMNEQILSAVDNLQMKYNWPELQNQWGLLYNFEETKQQKRASVTWLACSKDEWLG